MQCNRIDGMVNGVVTVNSGGTSLPQITVTIMIQEAIIASKLFHYLG